jgi:hypothetical protein
LTTVEELTIPEKKTLETIVLYFAEEPFTSETLEEAAQGRLTGYEAELGIERLRGRGILETRRKSWGERFHRLAPGCFAEWQQALIGEAAAAEKILLDSESVMPVQDMPTGFPKALFLFLADAAYDGLALTQKGVLHHRDLQRLTAKIDWPEEWLAGLNIQYLHQEKLPKSIAILYDAALRLGLVRNGAAKVEIVEERVESWLSLPSSAMEERLLDLWREVYTPRDVWLQHGAAWIQRLPEGRWCSVKAMTAALAEAGAATGGRSIEEGMRALEGEWLRPMAAIGFLELGERMPGGELAVRKPSRLEGEERWFVQPDLDILVPPAVSYRALWIAASCAERIGGHPLDTYKITKKSWTKALEAGKDPEKLLEALEAYAAHGIPDSVRTTLQQWSESFGAVSIQEAALLRIRREEDAAFLRQEESIAPFIAEVLNAQVFLIPKRHVPRLAEALKQLGFTPRLTREAEGAEAASSPKTASLPPSAGLVHSRRNAAVYPIDPAPEGTERLQERISKLPVSWLASLRQYHASTYRDMLETAAELRVSVKLLVAGREAEFIPKSLQQSGSEWTVRGWMDGKEKQIASAEIGGAQLVIPD